MRFTELCICSELRVGIHDTVPVNLIKFRYAENNRAYAKCR